VHALPATALTVSWVCTKSRGQLAQYPLRIRPGEPILNGVSLDIPAGERVALVGASGGGKSTLVQVLLGLYAPNSGQIAFDGVAVEKIGLEVVREHVATVLQHPALFNDTVRNNLTLGRKHADDALWQALQRAQLQELVQGNA